MYSKNKIILIIVIFYSRGRVYMIDKTKAMAAVTKMETLLEPL